MADGDESAQHGGQFAEGNLVRPVGRCALGILVGFEEDAVRAGGHSGGGEHGGEGTVSGGAVTAGARSLHGVGGVKDKMKSLLLDPRDRAHVGDEIVVAEGGATFGEEKLPATGGAEFLCDGGDFPR